MASDEVVHEVDKVATLLPNGVKGAVHQQSNEQVQYQVQHQLEHLHLADHHEDTNEEAVSHPNKLPSPSSTTECSSIRSPGEANGEPPAVEEEDELIYRDQHHDDDDDDEATPTVFHNIFINNLAPHITADELREVFEDYGQITSVVVMKDEVGNSRGFGFVNFLHAEDAASAVEGAQGQSTHGSVWNVAPAINKRGQQTGYLSTHYSQAGIVSEDKMNRNLYIRNLCRDVDEAMLLAAFSEYGNVESVRVLRDNYGNSRSVGFVQYHVLEDAMAALKGMNGRQMGTKTIYVQVARHHLDEAKKANTTDTAQDPHMLPGVTPVVPVPPPPRTVSMPAPPPGIPPSMMYPPPPPYMMMGTPPTATQPLMYVSAPGWQPMPPPVMPKTNVAAVREALDSIAADDDGNSERRNTVLGEALFPLVQQLTMDQTAVPKITGMLLELKDDDVLKLLDEPDYLQLKVWAAQRTLYGSGAGGVVASQPLLPAAPMPLAMYGRAVSADGAASMTPWYGNGMPRAMMPVAPAAPPMNGVLHRTHSNPIASMVSPVVPAAYRTASYGAPGAYVAAPPAAYGLMAAPPPPPAVMGGMYRMGSTGLPYAAAGGMYRTHSSSSGSGKRRGSRGGSGGAATTT